jgi:RHS repeat-associated protein
VTYTYDAAGRRATMSVPGQTQISYGYDNADRLTTITQGSAIISFAYDDAGRRISHTLPNGVVTEYGYDAASRLTSLSYKLGGDTLGTLSYGYNNGSEKVSVGGTWARTLQPAAVSGATYNAANHQLVFDAQTLTYDLNGNLTSDGTNTYTWDARNQLGAISGPTAATYAYDGLGRRRQKAINGSTIDFLYDGINAVQEQTGSTIVNLLSGLGVDERFVRSDPTGTRYLVVDALGSTVALIDGTGTIQTPYTYEAFGALTSGGASSVNSYGYTGREDDGVGVYHYRTRYYHPRLQRFISEDPIGLLAGDTNYYAYVENNPLSFRDPQGLFIDPVSAVGVLVLVAVLAVNNPDALLPPVLRGRYDEHVVRAGLADPKNLIEGTGPHRDIPGLTGFSVQHRPGLSVDELARGGKIPNGMISVTTVSKLRQHGFNVVYPTPGRGRYHATVQAPDPLPMEKAELLSSLFVRVPNPYPTPRR